MARRRKALTGGIDTGVPGPADTSGPRHVPALPIQINALQALCRQVFGFRLAMIALAAPFALGRTERGLPSVLVASAVLVTFMASYVLLRDWERYGPVLLRHPVLLAVDMLFGALLLVTASPASTLAYVTICTPLLAGLVYSWRGAAIFAVLQSLIVAGSYSVNSKVEAGVYALLLPGLCIIAGAVGSTLRNLMLGFGAASHALTEAHARLAVNSAVEEERARLARDMHDSVAKTLHGLAMAADSLADSADRMDPDALRRHAELVARSARRAAAESRELLSDLRRELGTKSVDLQSELAAAVADFARQYAVRATFRRTGRQPVPPIPHAVARQALMIAAEAMENARRHGRSNALDITTGLIGNALRMEIKDDGRGLPPGLSLDSLEQTGHFGLLGMVERAASIGARVTIGAGNAGRGTEVRLDLPTKALGIPPPEEWAGRSSTHCEESSGDNYSKKNIIPIAPSPQPREEGAQPCRTTPPAPSAHRPSVS